MDMRLLEAFKESQKESWSHFAPLEAVTTPPAARLIHHARVEPGHRVLDVGCGTGVAAVTAARLGAHVTGLDLTPALLERARWNADVAGVGVQWQEGDVEALPFSDATFDVVVSQFGHIFAPRPGVAIAEMLRVLRPGGVVAFSSWPPELFMGRMFALVARYGPPPPDGLVPPVLWGDVGVVRQRLGDAVHAIAMDHDRMLVPALSPRHHRAMSQRTAGPVTKVVDLLSQSDPQRLAAFCAEYDALVQEYFEGNVVHADYLMTRAVKR
jgi:SAM-dependent methyltransferase